MKVIEASATRLVAKENILVNYVVGGLCVLAGLGALGLGMANSKAVLAFGIIFTVAGLGTLLISRSEELTVDTATGQISVVNQGVLGKKSASYMISDVSAVRSVTDYRVNTKYSSGQTELVLKSGDTVAIEHAGGATGVGGKLAKLIGVAYSENAPAKPGPMPDALEKAAAPGPEANTQTIMPAADQPVEPASSANPASVANTDGSVKDKPSA